MPRLGEYKWIKDIVFFLYRSREDAISGANAGGTGFFVALPSKRWPDHLHHIHAVTNWHVAVRDGCSVIRVNKLENGTDTLLLGPEDWQFIPCYHDIAISPPLKLLQKEHQVEAVCPDFFLTSKDEEMLEIDAADDVFMVGRFIDYEGVEKNAPAFRFGHISIMNADIKQCTDRRLRSIVVDMHSRSGFSGSPVFVYRTHGSIFAKKDSFIYGGHMLKLLGIHWGQFPELWELKAGTKRLLASDHASHFIVDGKYVQGLSGMSCLCPSTVIRELLDLPRLGEMREAQEAEWGRRIAGRPFAKPESKPNQDAG